MRTKQQRKVEATVQRLLNEYPTASLERMLSWAARGSLAHDWDRCLNAAAVGHPIDGPVAVQRHIGVPAIVADVLARLWDRLGDDTAARQRTLQLVGEILDSRARLATRPASTLGLSWPQPDPAPCPSAPAPSAVPA
jgi:hypothetical protein